MQAVRFVSVIHICAMDAIQSPSPRTLSRLRNNFCIDYYDYVRIRHFDRGDAISGSSRKGKFHPISLTPDSLKRVRRRYWVDNGMWMSYSMSVSDVVGRYINLEDPNPKMPGWIIDILSLVDRGVQ